MHYRATSHASAGPRGAVVGAGRSGRRAHLPPKVVAVAAAATAASASSSPGGTGASILVIAAIPTPAFGRRYEPLGLCESFFFFKR
jgi:hypothetical protein